MARTVGSLEPGVQRLTTTGRWSAAVTSGFVAGIAVGLLMASRVAGARNGNRAG